MSYTLELIKKTLKYHGVNSTLHAVSLLAINKILRVKILKCALLTRIDSNILGDNRLYQIEFLDEGEIKKHFGKGHNDLPPEFAKKALKKGDQCLCVLDEKNEIAGYSWFSNIETDTDLDSWKITFDPAYMYTFKVFTETKHRGRRLHADQMNHALNYFKSKGKSGIVCYINSDNFDSLKSHYRMGFKDIGSIFTFKIFGKIYHISTGACKDHHVDLMRIEA